MKHWKIISFILILISTVLLILCPKPAIDGAISGINLCLKTLIPSLFPFTVLTTALLRFSRSIQIPILRSIGKICNLSPGAENLFLIGLLGGYPVGAKLISTMYQDNSISLSEAQRMLGFCNNAGPAFIFGVAGCMFSSPVIPLIIWLIHIISAIIVGVLLPKAQIKDQESVKVEIVTSNISLVEQCVHTMGIICGWVILFRIVISYTTILTSCWLPQELLIIITGILELSNGCIQLANITSPAMRFVICNGIISFGGICVSMQTSAVAHNIGLRHYFPGKMLQTTVCLILALILQFLLFPQPVSKNYIVCTLAICVLIASIILWRLYAEKNSGFYRYNEV